MPNTVRFSILTQDYRTLIKHQLNNKKISDELKLILTGFGIDAETNDIFHPPRVILALISSIVVDFFVIAWICLAISFVFERSPFLFNWES